MYYKQKTAIYPPVVSACPDYWAQTPDGLNCLIPNIGDKNVGTNTLVAAGTDPNNKFINFKDPKWSATQSAICAQKSWASTNGCCWLLAIDARK